MAGQDNSDLALAESIVGLLHGEPLRSSDIVRALDRQGSPAQLGDVFRILCGGEFAPWFVSQRHGRWEVNRGSAAIQRLLGRAAADRGRGAAPPVSAQSLLPFVAPAPVAQPAQTSVEAAGAPGETSLPTKVRPATGGETPASSSRTVMLAGHPVTVVEHAALRAFGGAGVGTVLCDASTAAAVAAEPSLPPGTALRDGRFTVLEALGAGGMGRVFRARDEQLGREVALKLVACADATYKAVLENEVAILRKLDRLEYFPRVYEPFGHGSGHVVVPMELVGGQTLEDFLRSTPPQKLPLATVLEIFHQIGDRLHHLHNFSERRILFKDLKPANVMIELDPVRIKLIDFGIAAEAGGAQLHAGSARFWAPEALGQRRYSVRSDIFALGRVLECLLACSPDALPPGEATALPLAESRRVPVRALEVARKLCHPDPSHRPESVRRAQDIVAAALGPSDAFRLAGQAERACPHCGFLDDPAFRLCARCGGWTSGPGEETNATVPVDILGELRGQVASALSSPQAMSRRRLELVEQAARLRRVPTFDRLTCLSHVSVEAYQYQQAAAIRVLRDMDGSAILADEVGLGKTIEAGLVLKEYLVRGFIRRGLILVPPALKEQWYEELTTKFNIENIKILGPDPERERRAMYTEDWRSIHRKPGLLIASHFKAIHDFRQVVDAHWDIVVVDEAHKAKTGKDGTRLGQLVESLASPRKLLLTATPVQNSLSDLFRLVNLVKPGKLSPDLRTFKQQFDGATKKGKGKPAADQDQVKVKNAGVLQRLLRSVVIRHRRAEVLKAFPTREPRTRYIDVPPRQLDAYRGMVGALQESGERGFTIQVRTQQFCTSYAAVEKICPAVRKVAREPHFKLAFFLNSVVPQLEATPKVLVFSRFVASQQEIAEALRARGHTALWATGTAGQRAAAVRQFRTDPQARFLVAGTGLSEGVNLQFCGCMVNFDLPWNPQQIEQRIGRIQRLGSTFRQVFIYNLAAKETVEAVVIRVLEDKLRIFAEVFGFVESVMGQFDDGESVEDLIRRALERGNNGYVNPALERKATSTIDEAIRRARDESQGSTFDDIFPDF